MQNRSADFQGLHTRIGSTGMASRQRRLFVTIVIPAICVIGAITSGSRTTLAQTAGHVGATCSVNSDCISGVCHPATHLCMISAAATQPASASYGANPDSSSAVCSAPSDQCMPKASGGTVGAGCSVNSDCISGVCHPATHLCMVSAAAAQPAKSNCNVNSDCDSAVCTAASHQCTASLSTSAPSARASNSPRAISAVRQ
jgi:hypothetical protein